MFAELEAVALSLLANELVRYWVGIGATAINIKNCILIKIIQN